MADIFPTHVGLGTGTQHTLGSGGLGMEYQVHVRAHLPVALTPNLVLRPGVEGTFGVNSSYSSSDVLEGGRTLEKIVSNEALRFRGGLRADLLWKKGAWAFGPGVGTDLGWLWRHDNTNTSSPEHVNGNPRFREMSRATQNGWLHNSYLRFTAAYGATSNVAVETSLKFGFETMHLNARGPTTAQRFETVDSPSGSISTDESWKGEAPLAPLSAPPSPGVTTAPIIGWDISLTF